MELTDLSTIKQILKHHDLWAKKFLGQNFLTSKAALEKIITAANIISSENILEIGPGIGVLTNELAKKAHKVTSIELDKSLFPVLKETLEKHNNVEIIHADALQYQPTNSPYKIVANIPYNITSPLINHFLQNPNRPLSMTLLVQKEVAEKITTTTPKMSILSLQVALFGKAKMIGKVANTCFHPAPKVDSAIIHIDLYPKDSPHYLDTESALKVLKTAKRAFKQGRKKLSNTIPDYKEKLEKLELSNKRPQHLEISDWLALVN